MTITPPLAAPLASARIIEIHADTRQIVLITEGEWHRIDWPHGLALPRLGDLYAWPLIGPVLDTPRLLGQAAVWDAASALYWQQPVAWGTAPRLQILKKRHRLMRMIRDYLDGQDFLELETPLLVHGTTPDLALHSFAVGDRYLITSSEYQIKRLIAGGAARVYTLTKNFRHDPISPVHNPEFSMLEWARVGVDLTAIEQDVENFVS